MRSVSGTDADRLEAVAAGARAAHADLAGVEVIWRQDCYQLATGRTSFGFKDGIGQPAIEGSGVDGTNPHQPPIKAGEFLLGYPDETGELPPMPTPEVLGRNGTYIVFRNPYAGRRVPPLPPRARHRPGKRNCCWRQDGRAVAERRRWHSAPTTTSRNSAQIVAATTHSSTATIPAGSSAHWARTHAVPTPDAFADDAGVNVRLHHMIRRGTSYGPMLPDGALEDDGVDRGIVFVFAGAHLKRQFEFVKTTVAERRDLHRGPFRARPACRVES